MNKAPFMQAETFKNYDHEDVECEFDEDIALSAIGQVVAALAMAAALVGVSVYLLARH